MRGASLQRRGYYSIRDADRDNLVKQSLTAAAAALQRKPAKPAFFCGFLYNNLGIFKQSYRPVFLMAFSDLQYEEIY